MLKIEIIIFINNMMRSLQTRLPHSDHNGHWKAWNYLNRNFIIENYH